MRTHHTFRIGLAMAAGAIVAGCANGVESPAASSSAASSPSVPSSAAVSPAEPSSVPSSVPEPSATTGSTGKATKPPATSDPLPTITLTGKPPKEPTDQQPNTGWVAGMVTRGGTGPCYGIIADDGQRYALYSTAGTDLTQGARVKVNLETTMLRIYCGPGTLMAMTEAEPIK